MITGDAADILLVEDNPNDLELALHALQKYKITNDIAVARDGEEALKYLFNGDGTRRARPHLILLDLKLPKVDGLEVLQRLKAHPETQSIPVVILTSSREERDIVKSYRLGVNSFIVKPVDFGQFTEAIRQIGMYWVVLNQPPRWSPNVEDEPD